MRKVLCIITICLISSTLFAQSVSPTYYDDLIPEVNGKRVLSFRLLTHGATPKLIHNIASNWMRTGYKDGLDEFTEEGNSFVAKCYFRYFSSGVMRESGSLISFDFRVIPEDSIYTITFNNFSVGTNTMEGYKNMAEQSYSEVPLNRIIAGCNQGYTNADMKKNRKTLQFIYDKLKSYAGGIRKAVIESNKTSK